MKKKFPKMDDEDIVMSLDMLINESDTSKDAKLKGEREKIQKYYDGDSPLPSSKGNSSFVSQDVFDQVESMKSALLETFAAGNEIGTFEPHGEADVEHAKLSARYVDNVVFFQNDGFTIMDDVMTDGLMNRIGVAKVHWEKNIKEEDEDFDNIGPEELLAIAKQESEGLVEIVSVEQSDFGRYEGTLKRKTDLSQVRIEAISNENFLLGGRARDTQSAFMAHIIEFTRSQLRERGIDEDTIEEIGDANSAVWQIEPEVLARYQEANTSSEDRLAFQEQVQKVRAYECFVDIDIDGTGKTKLWRILKAGKIVLEKERVKCRPFLVFAPLRRPHAVMGSSFASKVIGTQNAKTVLIRGVLDHTVRTNNPRHTVLKGTLTKPDEMTDNRMGGLVNVNRPDGIKPLEQPSLNPFVFNTTQLLDSQLEGTTGVSKLSQGLNKDAVSKQNSTALVEQLTTMSMQRQKIIARGFAIRFLRPLFELVYEVVMENDDRKHMIEVAGNWVEVEPSRWTKRKSFNVQLALGYGEKDRVGGQWAAYHQMMAADPMYGPKQRFNTISRILESKSCKDPQNYIMKPEELQPPQPDPIKMAELEIMKTKAETDKFRAQTEFMKVQASVKLESNKHETAIAEVTSGHAVAGDRLELDTRKQDFHEMATAAELKLAAEAPEQKAIISPND